MDIASVAGIGAAFVFLGLGVILARGDFALFFDPPSIMVTVLGSLSGLVASNSMSYIMGLGQIMKFAFFPPDLNAKDMIVTLVSFSEKARREGLLALEDDLHDVDDEFLKKGIQLVVDGTDPALLAPAFGMIGTLMGLILMMVNLEDKSAIGPGMSTALITTLYGAIMANAVLMPISAKLEVRANEEALIKLIMIEGTLSIQSGDNPRIVRDKLIAFLDPAQREEITQEIGE